MTAFADSGLKKDWHNLSEVQDTPTSAEALENLEDRVTDYTDVRVPQAAIGGKLFISTSAGNGTWVDTITGAKIQDGSLPLSALASDIATQAELNAAQTALQANIDAKQDLAGAATDAELATHAGLSEGVHGLPNTTPGKALRRNATDDGWEGFSAVSDPGGATQDLLVRSGAGWAALTVGAPGQQLIVRQDGTVAWVDSPTVYMPAWANGDGTDERVAIAAALASLQPGDQLDLGHNRRYHSTTTQTITVPHSIKGGGTRSAFSFACGTSADGLVVDGPSLMHGVHWENFLVCGGANAARKLVVWREVLNSEADAVYVRGGATYAVSLEGCLSNRRLNFICSNNMALPYTANSPINGIQAISTAGYPFGANELDCIVEGLPGDPLLIDGAAVGGGDAADPGNNTIRGTYQGNTGHIYIRNIGNFTVTNAHMEATAGQIATQNKLIVEGCWDGALGPDLLVDAELQLSGTRDMTVDGVRANAVTEDSACTRTEWGLVEFNLNNGSFVRNGTEGRGVGRIIDRSGRDVDSASSSASPTVPGSPESTNYFRNPGFEYWVPGGQPCMDVISNQGSLAKVDGTGGTFKRSGKFAAKLSASNEAARLQLGAEDFERLKGRHVTFSIWAYIPSGQANQPSLQASFWLNGGSPVVRSQAVTTTDNWTRLSVTAYIAAGTTQLEGVVTNTNAGHAGDWYIDDASIVVGRISPRDVAPRIPLRFSAQATYNPGSVADNTQVNTTVVVPGAARGDLAHASFDKAISGGVLLSANVTDPDTVTVTILNRSGGAFAPGSGLLRADAVRY